MRFLWRDTLRRMAGSETQCPVCKEDGLVVCERYERDVLPDLRGIPYCECPHCRARGDFPELVARATDRGTEETVRELYRIGEIEASGRDIDTYVSRKLAQAEVSAHLDKCVEKLRAAPHLCGIRAGLSVATIRQLPPDTGMYVAAEAPRQFALLSSTRYARVPMVTYRYRFDGETTCIDAQNPKTLQREHRIRITGDVGVYLGDFRVGEVPSVLVGTANPRTAGQIYGAMRAESSLPPPVVGIAGFPLPQQFGVVRTLYLLDTPDSPLPLSFAIRSISGPTVYGSERTTVKVLSTRSGTADITAADIRMLSNASTHGKPVREWIAEKLLSLGDRREEAANALIQSGATDNTRAEIADMLGPTAPESLKATILLPTTEPDDIVMLGNGRLVKNTPVGLYAVSRSVKTGEVKTRSLLCNVGITVDARILSSGHETAVCTVTHPDADVPAVSVRLPRAHWNNPDALAEDIRDAYAACGRTPYVAFYRTGGYGWSDILQLLGSHCPVQSGIRVLGATADGELNLPNVRISRGRADAQTKASLLDPDALNAYSAMPLDASPADAVRLSAFLHSGVSLERTGVAAGVLHALFCAAGKMFDPSGVRRPPAHLLFVETEPGVWDVTLRTLAYLFSGSEYIPLMDYGEREEFLSNWAALGTLPLVTRLPSADNIAAVLSSSPVSVIGVADPLTALSCSGRGTFSFVLPHVETSEGAPISPEDIEDLRKAFVGKATEKAGTGWLDIGCGGAVSLSTPCLTTLGAMTDERDAGTVAGGLYRSVKGRYPGVGLTGARTFFSVLHRAYLADEHGDNTGIRITMVTGTPTDAVKASFNERGEHAFILPDKVIVSRSVVQLINREQTFLFDAEQLSHEFEENGILINDALGALGIDSRRVWVFPRSVWDEEVVRTTGFTTRKDAK